MNETQKNYEKSFQLPFDKSEESAMETFYNNFAKIEAHNMRPNETYEQGLMEDSDMTYDEIRAYRQGVRLPLRKKRSPIVCLQKLEMNFTIPKSSKRS